MKEVGDYFELKEKIIVCINSGIQGTEFEYDYDEFDVGTMIEVELNLKLPKSLWEPIVLKVEVPEDYSKALAIGVVEEVSTPLAIEAEMSQSKFSYFAVEDVSESSTGLMAVLKRKVTNLFDGIRSEAERKEMVSRQKEKRIEQLKKELKELEGDK